MSARKGKARMGRASKPADERKTEVFTLRLNPDELAAIQVAAGRAGRAPVVLGPVGVAFCRG